MFNDGLPIGRVKLVTAAFQADELCTFDRLRERNAVLEWVHRIRRAVNHE